MIGSLGLPELVVIFVVALLLFGPRKMPQIGQSIGRALSEFRRASNDFKRTIEEEVAADELRSVQRDLRQAVDETKTTVHHDKSSAASTAGSSSTSTTDGESK